MKSISNHKLEWGLSLLNKYSVIIIEERLDHLHLTKTQMLFIIHLKQSNGIHQDYLARMFKMNRSTITRAINVLVDLDYVEKQVDQSNKKANFIKLTPTGDKAYNEVCIALNDWIDIITTDFTEEEVQASMKLVARMAANACKHKGDDYLSNIITRDRG